MGSSAREALGKSRPKGKAAVWVAPSDVALEAIASNYLIIFCAFVFFFFFIVSLLLVFFVIIAEFRFFFFFFCFYRSVLSVGLGSRFVSMSLDLGKVT